MSQIYKIQSVIRSKFRVIDSITSASGETLPCIEGYASHSDVISQKGYRYRAGFWDKIINDEKLQSMIEARDMLGMIEHPRDDYEYMKTPYDKASHIIIRAWMAGKDPKIIAALLNNPQGNAIKALTDVGHRPGVSTRAFGSSQMDSVSEYMDENDYQVITWDIVRNPNFEDIKLTRVSDSLQATPEFREIVQMYHLRDSVDDHYNRDHLLSDMGKLLRECTAIYEKLKNENNG